MVYEIIPTKRVVYHPLKNTLNNQGPFLLMLQQQISVGDSRYWDVQRFVGRDLLMKGWVVMGEDILYRIHVWFVFLHVVDFYGQYTACIGKYTIHGSYDL